MSPRSDERLTQLIEMLSQDPGIPPTLPGDQRAIVEDALSGKKPYEIANDHRVPESYVWEVLGNAARLASGQGYDERTEVGGLGSDTDPGVTGGYGDTGFGAIGNDGPVPNPGEPGSASSEE